MPPQRALRRSIFALTVAAAASASLPGVAAAQWAILYGPNGHIVRGIPAEAAKTLAEQAAKRAVLHSVTFAPRGGWVVLSGADGYRTHHISDEAFNMIAELRKERAQIRSLAFARGDSWVFIVGNSFHARNIADEVSEKLDELVKNGSRLKFFAFAPDEGWVVLFDRNGYFARNIPDDASRKLAELAKKNAELKSVAFPPDGGWAILHDQSGVAMKDLPPDAAKTLNELAANSADIKSLTFTTNPLIPLSKDNKKSRDDVLKRMEKFHVPGLGIAVIDKYKLAWARGYGVLRAGDETPVTVKTRFQAASLSKPVSAVAALRLVQQRKLNLDEDLNARLVSWQIPENEFTRQKKPTLRHVLSHSAGFNVHGFAGYDPDAPVPTLVQLLDGQPPSRSPAIRVESVPGEKFRYSGGGYCVMQQLLIDVTGKPFAESVHEQVLGPAGMKHSAFTAFPLEEWEAHAAVAHFADGRPFEHRWKTDEPALAAAALWTTPEDYSKFVLALIDACRGRPKPILAAPTLKEMLTRQADDYGLGVHVSRSDRSLCFWHGGVNAGYRCHMIGFPATGQGAVLMTNSDDGAKLWSELVESLRIEYDWPG